VDNIASHQSRLAHILENLRAHRRELQSIGVRHAIVFGWVVRGQARPDSDIDIAVETDLLLVRTLFDYGDIQQRLREWLNHPVDLARLDRLRPGIAEELAVQGIHAF
jgi:uncharacterized protein